MTGQRRLPTLAEVGFALASKCHHAIETHPGYLGDQRVRDCPECLKANITAALIHAMGGEPTFTRTAQVLTLLSGGQPDAVSAGGGTEDTT